MDNLTKSSLNFLTSSHLDRMAGIRYLKKDFDELITGENIRFLLNQKGENLLLNEDGSNPVILKLEDISHLGINSENCFLLGTKEGLTYFTIDTELCDRFFTPENDSKFLNLRKSQLVVKNWTGSMLAYSNALVAWHKNHHFCGKCGAPTKSEELGQARYCSRETCSTPHYPRTDPAIIVVVTSGEKCLMARKAEWPEGMYALVAGYVDHGESLEDTVVREVMEETAIKVKSVHYHSSQPWPFPYTLMVGFFAEAENENITVDHHELEDARWISREELIEGLKAGTQKLPTNYSISRKLISEWFNRGNYGSLTDYI
jgi:NAD+ diphosphatase